MTLNRKLHKAYARVREGNFTLNGLAGYDVHGKTVGIVGTGKIGTLTAKILGLGFGAKLLAYDAYVNPEFVAMGGEYVSMGRLMQESDIISCVPRLASPRTPAMCGLASRASPQPALPAQQEHLSPHRRRLHREDEARREPHQHLARRPDGHARRHPGA